MARPKLPIGIQNFPEIRTQGYAYVDKTPWIARMAESGKAYFLSRPRRFGKSLFVDTLDCAFSGRRELFDDLYLAKPEAGWDWGKKHPILRIDFAGGTLNTPEELRVTLDRLLKRWIETYGLRDIAGTPGQRLLNVIESVCEKTEEKVVVLVDEFDKPILDTLDDTQTALSMRDALKDFYGALKPADPWLRLVFLTGVSKFSKTGIFSGLNHLNDLTLDKRYAAVCGYTQNDLDTVFVEWFSEYDRDMVREWYNGYNWLGESVCNPFDVLLLFDKGTYRPWWFETGTPSFLVRQWQAKPRALPDLDRLITGEEFVGAFEIENLKTETLLFQAGYLTVKEMTSDPYEGTYFTLGFPNREVREAFSRQLLPLLSGGAEPADQRHVRSLLENGDADGLRSAMASFFASIPHDWYRNNPIRKFEGYYSSVVYAWFASLGYEIIPEDTTNKGRVDLTVKTKKAIWLFEFKVKNLDRSGEQNPLEQLREKRYAEKYRNIRDAGGSPLPIHLVGVVFEGEERNIEVWEHTAAVFNVP